MGQCCCKKRKVNGCQICFCSVPLRMPTVLGLAAMEKGDPAWAWGQGLADRPESFRGTPG